MVACRPGVAAVDLQAWQWPQGSKRVGEADCDACDIRRAAGIPRGEERRSPGWTARRSGCGASARPSGPNTPIGTSSSIGEEAQRFPASVFSEIPPRMNTSMLRFFRGALCFWIVCLGLQTACGHSRPATAEAPRLKDGESHASLNGIRHWYRIAGAERGTTPLVIVHGGPSPLTATPSRSPCGSGGSTCRPWCWWASTRGGQTLSLFRPRPWKTRFFLYRGRGRRGARP